MPTAILVDGAFFLRRHNLTYGHTDAAQTAKTLHTMCLNHLNDKQGNRVRDLYRIFVYDCHPLTRKAQHPLSGDTVDFSETSAARFRREFHNELKTQRKVVLRIGHLDAGGWSLRPDAARELFAGDLHSEDLHDDDIHYPVRQKGVEMRIGLDVGTLTYKRQADQIVLITGQTDFAPAAKLARREGIDFILDPMWHPIPAALNEHIDGLRSVCPRPERQMEAGR
jgi:uncharacterized LabA/DUF88 family protein